MSELTVVKIDGLKPEGSKAESRKTEGPKAEGWKSEGLQLRLLTDISGNIFSSAGVHNDIAKYAPYREGYEFSGWSSTENGSEVEYAFDEMLEASRVYYTMEDGSVVLSVNERRPFYAVYDIH